MSGAAAMCDRKIRAAISGSAPDRPARREQLATVKPISPFQFVYAGVLHWYLHRLPAGAAIHGPQGVVTYLTAYLEQLDLNGFSMTRSAVWGLNGIREELEGSDAEATLSAETAQRINRLAYEARETLYAE